MTNQLSQALRLLARYPNFARFWAGQFVSLFGDAMTFIALPWFVLQQTGSGTITAAILLTLQLPAIASGVVVGSLIDRYQPRTIIALDNGFRSFIIALIPVLYWLGALDLWLLFLLVLLAGLLQPATVVGARTILPDLVDDTDLAAANMLWSLSINLSVVIGPALAGILVATFGAPAVLLLDTATFVVMALVAISLPILTRTPSAAQTSLSERLGLRQLWRIKVVRLTTLLSLVFFFSYGPLEAALPLYSSNVLQTDARGYGLLWTFLGIGALFGTLASTIISKHLRLGLALPLIALLWGASLVPLIVVHHLWLACTALLIGGLVWGPYTPLETTLLQQSVPKAQLGRVFGARSTLLTSGSPLGLAVGGALLAVAPSTALIALSAIACMLVGLGGLASPTLRELSFAAVSLGEPGTD